MCFQTFLSCKLFLTVRSHKRSKNLKAWWKMTRPDTLFSYQTPKVHRRFGFNGAWNSIVQIARVSFEIKKQIIFSEVLQWALWYCLPGLNYTCVCARYPTCVMRIQPGDVRQNTPVNAKWLETENLMKIWFSTLGSHSLDSSVWLPDNFVSGRNVIFSLKEIPFSKHRSAHANINGTAKMPGDYMS